jgi:hypothetical protein
MSRAPPAASCSSSTAPTAAAAAVTHHAAGMKPPTSPPRCDMRYTAAAAAAQRSLTQPGRQECHKLLPAKTASCGSRSGLLLLLLPAAVGELLVPWCLLPPSGGWLVAIGGCLPAALLPAGCCLPTFLVVVGCRLPTCRPLAAVGACPAVTARRRPWRWPH